MVKSNKEIVIDGKGHLVGRLAAKIAKAALEGTAITVVRAEELRISGSLFRNRMKYMNFLRKHSNTNPRKHSHIHYRAPSKLFKRCVRGMIPHKTPHGADALKRIKAVEGVPHKWNVKKRMVVPDALSHLRLKPTMATTRLGDLCGTIGWKHDAVVGRLEAVRKERSAQRYEQKKAAAEDKEAKKQAALKTLDKEALSALALIQ